MKRFMRRVAAPAIALALGVLGPVAVSAPADAYSYVGRLTNASVEVHLETSEIVAIYNDPFAAGRICNQILQDMQSNRVFFAPVNIGCGADLRACARWIVANRYFEGWITWTWTSVYQCNPYR